MYQINKQLLKKRFKKSLNTYNDEAYVQKRMIIELLNALKKQGNSDFNKIFEIGCGTGLLTHSLRMSFSPETLYVNDIVEDCKTFLTPELNAVFLPGDAESIDFPEKLDLIISNAAFQWFLDYKRIFKKVFESLNSEGILAFSTFTPDNLTEIQKVTGCSLDYASSEYIKEVTVDKFILLYEQSEKIKLYFDTPTDVLRHLKRSGVNSLSSKAWTKKTLQQFNYDYRTKFSEDSKVYLTYTPEYFILQKKKIGR